MAIIKHGILGGFKGKAGTVVGYRLKDQDVMRGLPNVRSTPVTKGELANRTKFVASQVWLQPLTEFLRVGFKDYTARYEGFVAAKSYNSKHAMTQDDAGFYVDPELALVSFGDQNQANVASVSSEAENSITLTWEGGEHAYDDRAMYVVYDIDGRAADFDTASVRRSLKKGTFQLNKDFSGKSVYVYLAFVSEDRKRRSNSQYLGVVTIL